jgi:hypothetical protein
VLSSEVNDGGESECIVSTGKMPACSLFVQDIEVICNFVVLPDNTK